jgi:hypothetical protein
MILKTFILLIGVLLAASFFLRRPQAKLTGWIVVASLIALGVLAVQVLRTLDTLWR